MAEIEGRKRKALENLPDKSSFTLDEIAEAIATEIVDNMFKATSEGIEPVKGE